MLMHENNCMIPIFTHTHRLYTHICDNVVVKSTRAIINMQDVGVNTTWLFSSMSRSKKKRGLHGVIAWHMYV